VTRPKLLDLFCGAGGCSVGYHRAGFDVVGVDINPQPRYPFEFHQADALEVLADADFLAGFDVIHASPPCQAYANVTAWRGNHGDHPDLVPTIIELLEQIGVPAIVENVPEAPIRQDWLLCGSQFGLRVRRHRAFQAVNWTAFDLLPPCHHRDLLPFMHKAERAYADAMGCDWMTNREAREAIPPQYAEYIGGQLLDHVRAAA
jgi:DNA (cytosine-5)-methyltransferase 1